MAAHRDLITEAAEGALEEIKKRAPEEYAKLDADPATKEKIFQAATATAQETLKLTEECSGQPQDIAERLAKHLSQDRIKLIQGGLNIPTFRMEIVRKDDGKHWLEFNREGREFLPTRLLASAVDIDWGNIQQYASILIEAVLLVMSAVGISISPSTSVIEKTVDETVVFIRSSSKMQQALDAFVEAWDAAGGSAYEEAKALFYLMKDSYAAGILWNTIKELCSNMSWYEWLETSAKVSAMLIASLATDGAALIAEIALIVLSAVDFAKKIANIGQLSDVKEALSSNDRRRNCWKSSRRLFISLLCWRTATQRDLITEAAEGALEEIKKRAPEEYAKLDADPATKEKIFQAATATAQETLKLTEECSGQPQDIAERLAKHLSQDRIKLIQGGLNIPTFRMEIVRKDDGKHWLEFNREGREFLPTRLLASAVDIDWGNIQQYASILIEAVLLVMSAVGISISPSTSVIEKTVDETVVFIRSSSKMQQALDAFVEAWDAAGGSAYEEAKALFYLMKDSYAAGILWNTIKELCSNMSWYEWLETSAKVSAMLIASLATDGAALIAEIALIVLSAVDFAKKIANIGQLSDVKKAM